MKSIYKVSIILGLALILTFIYFFPLFFAKGGFGIQDWDQNMAWNEFSRVSILKYGQFPLWNPYRCGGLPQFGNPEIGVISIQTLLVLILGTPFGIKMSLAVYTLIGFIGFYLYARQRLSESASFLSAVIYVFSGITASFISTGMVVFIVFAFIPYTLLFFEKGILNWKYLFISSLIYMVSFYNGYHISLLLGVYMLIYSIILSIVNKSVHPFFRFIIFTVITTVFIFPRLVLSLELMKNTFKISFDHSGYSLLQLIVALLSPFQDLFHDKGIARYSWKVDETSIYIGIPAFILFCLSFLSKMKSQKKILLYAILIVTTLFAAGYLSPIPFFEWLKKIPLFQSFRVAQRFRFLLIIPLSLLIGYGLEFLNRNSQKRILPIFLILLIYADLVYFAHTNYFHKIFIYDVPVTQSKKLFSQVYSAKYESTLIKGLLPKEQEESNVFSMWSFEYPSLLENKGVINCTDTVLNIKRVSGFGKKEYRGEWYLLNNGGKLLLEKWTPQKVEFTVFLTEREEDVLILNQNYYPGWYINVNGQDHAAQQWNKLLSAPVQRGETHIVFSYEPYREIFSRFIY